MTNFLAKSGFISGVLLLATALLMGCASDPTTSTVDPTVDLGKYETYAFLQDLATDKEQYASLESSFLKKAVARELDARGLRQSENPDLLINFSIETQEKIRSTPTASPGVYGGIGYDPFYDVYYDGWGATHSTRIDQYTEGRLNIDAIDAAAKKLVWQGSTSGRITKKDMQNMEETLDAAVVEIFNKLDQPES